MKKHPNRLIAMTLLCSSWLLAAACVPAQDEPGRFQADNEQGNADTPDSLGSMYNDGEATVMEDDREARRWFRIAVEQGHASAQFNLGLMYDNGLGVIEDDMLAHMGFNIASANGRVSVAGIGPEESRANLEREMTSAQISRAIELARTCMASDYQNCGP